MGGIVVLLGHLGAGKTEVARQISEEFGLLNISSNFALTIAAGAELGRKVVDRLELIAHAKKISVFTASTNSIVISLD